MVAGADDLAALEAADVKRDGQLVLRPVLVEDPRLAAPLAEPGRFPALSGLIMGGVAAARSLRRQRARRIPAGVSSRLARRESPLSEVLDDFTAEFRETFRATFWADFTANIVRNIWSNAIIFCGHFPDQTYTFSPEEVESETKGAWYVRQLVGAANIDGSPLFHVASGNLSYQVEHHLYPDMPSTRYNQIAPKVRDVCKRYGLPYNTGPFSQQ